MIKAIQQFELYGKATFVKASVKPPFKIIAEMQHEACFYYVLEGNAAVISPVDKITSSQGEGILLECGNYINEYVINENNTECTCIGIHLYPEVLKMIYDKELPDFLKNLNNIKPIKYKKYTSSTLLKNYIDSLLFYFENPALVSEELLRLKIKELILLLAKTSNSKKIHDLLAGLYNPSHFDFKTIIESNIFNNLNLEELSVLANLSLSSFKREFKKHYNTSPAKYIKERKLEKAAQLLQKTNLRITEISFECGFSDLAYFSKSFQKAYQASPSQYRTKVTNL